MIRGCEGVKIVCRRDKCQNMFEPRQGTQLFCSEKCRLKHHKVLVQRRAREKKKVPLLPRVCARNTCGATFAPRRPNQLYCDAYCQSMQNKRKVKRKSDACEEEVQAPEV